MDYIAFILNLEQATEKITLLDERLGKIKVHSDKRVKKRWYMPVVGSLILYSLSDTKKTFNSLDMIMDPMKLARHELLFLQQIITICYYCIPAGCPVPSIFRLLLAILTVPEIPLPYSVVGKKMILLFVFFHCGIFPVQLLEQENIRNYLLSERLEDIFKANYTITESELNLLLDTCIKQHPQEEKLKIVLRN